jgi:hypothetical protein
MLFLNCEYPLVKEVKVRQQFFHVWAEYSVLVFMLNKW